jgi:hypothetical protein
MLQVAFGIGLVATGLLLPRLGERVVTPASLAASVMLSGLTAALYVGTSIPAFAFAGVFLWGVDVAFFAAPSRTLLQRYAPMEAHGRVLALNRSLHSWSDLVALPVTGFAAGLVGVQAAAMSFAVVALAAGTYGLSRSRSVLGGDLVGDDVHLGLVGVDLDLAGLAAEPSALLVAAPAARPVEALLGRRAAAGAGDRRRLHRQGTYSPRRARTVSPVMASPLPTRAARRAVGARVSDASPRTSGKALRA